MTNWSDYFYYDETSPSCLRWKGRMSRAGTSLKYLDGKPAGGTNPNGYWIIRVFCVKTAIAAHRIIWEMFHGKIEGGLFVDHIDRNRGNNKISNLRLVTNQQNTQNAKKRFTNKSGATGVHLWKRETKSGYNLYWRAQAIYNGKRISKIFSCKIYGYDLAFKMACEYRLNLIEQLNKSGCHYTENHGKEL